ncbi:MAG: T9SS type A sorting domain-containing protein, partial [Candidatus Cloacimonadaceae bacterium]|nr:T9SS type A sorting domain-containing protein [Candidatus Cloacimonadaceae bacterium]
SGSFFVALFKKNSLGGVSRYVIERWISHAEALSGSLNHSQILERSYNISLANIDINALAASYRLYYWYQLNGGGDILFSDYADFASIVSNDDQYLPTPSLTIYPNPLRGDGLATIQIDAARSMRELSYSVYNLRGQKLFSERIEGSPFTIPAKPFPASGVYLIRVSYSDELGPREIRRKISIIK